MQILLDIPDDLAAALVTPGTDPVRAALEAFALEAYRERRMTGFQVRNLLGFGSRYEFEGFLKAHRVEKYTLDELEQDLAVLREWSDIKAAS